MNALAQKDKQKQSVASPAETEKLFMSPDVNIFETENGYVLEAEMPGVNKDNLEVTLDANSLTIVGHRPDDAPQATLLYRESRPADFRRVFELDPAIDTARIHAQMTQGLLTLELPKTEAVKPRKIKVE